MVGRCVVVTRELRGGSRIVETEQSFSSVEELIAFCVGLRNPNMVDRLSISGEDGEGRTRVLTFSLQSISVPPLPRPRE
ncbi:MAG: hypothetical protein LC672_06910 [Acidobacteria bacterium]|nr:hypothetical protein [Acidobacteriota bacterium]